MGSSNSKQSQGKSTEQRARRSSAIKAAVQQYQKDFPKQRIGVENGQYDSVLFKRAVFMAFDSGRSVQRNDKDLFCAFCLFLIKLVSISQD